MMKPMVTVFMPCYNPGDYLNKALKSVFEQTYKNWRIILVDNASTDDSLQKAEKYLNDTRVTVIHNAED